MEENTTNIEALLTRKRIKISAAIAALWEHATTLEDKPDHAAFARKLHGEIKAYLEGERRKDNSKYSMKATVMAPTTIQYCRKCAKNAVDPTYDFFWNKFSEQDPIYEEHVFFPFFGLKNIFATYSVDEMACLEAGSHYELRRASNFEHGHTSVSRVKINKIPVVPYPEKRKGRAMPKMTIDDQETLFHWSFEQTKEWEVKGNKKRLVVKGAILHNFGQYYLVGAARYFDENGNITGSGDQIMSFHAPTKDKKNSDRLCGITLSALNKNPRPCSQLATLRKMNPLDIEVGIPKMTKEDKEVLQLKGNKWSSLVADSDAAHKHELRRL